MLKFYNIQDKQQQNHTPKRSLYNKTFLVDTVEILLYAITLEQTKIFLATLQFFEPLPSKSRFFLYKISLRQTKIFLVIQYFCILII